MTTKKITNIANQVETKGNKLKSIKFKNNIQECDTKIIKKNFDDQCSGRDNCILNNSLLGCSGYDFDLIFDNEHTSEEEQILSNMTEVLDKSTKRYLATPLSSYEAYKEDCPIVRDIEGAFRIIQTEPKQKVYYLIKKV